MEPQPLKPKTKEKGDASAQNICAVNIKTETTDGNEKGMSSGQDAMKGDVDDGETLMQPLFVSIKTEPDFGETSEETISEENWEAFENAEDMEGCDYTVKGEVGDEEKLLEPLFVPVKTEPDFERTNEETILEENCDAAENLEDGMRHATGVPEGENSRATTHLVESMDQMRDQSKERSFKCPVCGKSFTQNGNLGRHMRLHSGEKPFMCDVCGKSFTHSNTLTIHMRSHSGEKPFECQECGKAFTDKSNLNTHMRSHTGVKPYRCTACGKAFSLTSSLNCHMRIHTGERPFACNNCTCRYADSSALRRHMRSVHRVASSAVKNPNIHSA